MTHNTRHYSITNLFHVQLDSKETNPLWCPAGATQTLCCPCEVHYLHQTLLTYPFFINCVCSINVIRRKSGSRLSGVTDYYRHYPSTDEYHHTVLKQSNWQINSHMTTGSNTQYYLIEYLVPPVLQNRTIENKRGTVRGKFYLVFYFFMKCLSSVVFPFRRTDFRLSSIQTCI